MIDLRKHKIVDFFEIADIERAQNKKVYCADCVLLQVSATKGQLCYLKEASKVDGKYAVIIPKNIYGKYLFFILKESLPTFLATYQTGLNIKPEILKNLKLDIHTETETQKHIAELMETIDRLIEKEEKQLNNLQDMKKHHLDKMIC